MWNRLVLQDACSLISRGISPKYLDTGGVRVLNQKCIRNHTIDYSLARRHDISKKGVKQERFIQKGDVLINSTGHGTLGRVAQVRDEPDEPTTVDSHVTIVRPMAEFFYLDYFGFAAIFIEDEIKAAGQGTSGQTELSKTKLKEEFYVSFPEDFTEQQRIVAKLDAAFAEIDGAIKTVEKNVKNSKLIFQTLRNEIYQKVADTAPNVELETIAKLSRGHNPPKSKFIDIPKDGYVRFYQIRDAKSDKFATYVPDDSKLHKVTERDFLMNAYRYVGEVFRGVSGAFNVALCKLSIIDFEKVNEDYLYYMVPSHLIKGELLKTSARSLIPSMSVKELAKLKVPIPSFQEQKKISTKIIDVEQQQIVLLNIYKEKLYQLTNLKSAILAQELQSEAA
jgi:type I restriction enzyme S subunit